MVYLINPPSPDKFYISRIGRCITKTKADYIYPPTELLYVASLLRKNGFPVKVIDGVFLSSYNSIFNEIKSPDFVILMVGIFSYEFDSKFISDIKNRFPGAKVIVFGQGASFLTNVYLDVADYVIYGEPEQAIAFIIKGEKDICAVSYKIGSTKIINKKPNYIKDLDELPYPARDLIDNSVYKHAFLRPYAMVYSSRGCPFRCIFCTTASYSPKYRIRSVENVIGELKELKDIYHVSNFGFIDDTFVLDKKRVMKICQSMLDNNLEMKWIALGRVDCVDPEMLRLMKEAGCRIILYGIESFDQKILDYMQKKITVGQIDYAVRQTKKAGIEVHGFFIFGSPLDSLQAIRETIRKAQKLNLDYASFNVFVPYPGTESFRRLEEQNLILTRDWIRYDQTYGGLVFKHAELKDKDIKYLIRLAYIKFYLNHNFILKRLKKDFCSFGLLKRDLRNMFKLFSNFLASSD